MPFTYYCHFIFLWTFLAWPSFCLLQSVQLIYEQRVHSQMGTGQAVVFWCAVMWLLLCISQITNVQ